MPKTIARVISIFSPSSRQLAVASIANAAYDRGYQDHEAVCLTEHATAGKAAAA